MANIKCVLIGRKCEYDSSVLAHGCHQSVPKSPRGRPEASP